MTSREHDPSRPVVDRPLRPQEQIAFEELAAIAGLTPMGLARLVRLGLLAPLAPGATHFSPAAALRVKRMLRLRADLGVGLFSAAIIVDLLERLDRLEK